MKRLTDLLISARRFMLSYNFCTSFLSSLFVPGVSLLSARRFTSSYLWGLNNPSPLWLEELHADGKAVALQWLAVSNTTRGAKLSSARGEYQWFALFPTAHAYHARATRTHILCKSRFRSWRSAMAVNQNGNFHRDAPFDPVKRKSLRVRHGFVHPHRHAAMRVRF